MSKEQWSAVDQYFMDTLIRQDQALELALEDSTAAGLPSINVSPAQGKLLHLLVKMLNARKILEIGTLGGYSAIWMARALPSGGKVISLEVEAKHAELAQKNIARAGVGARVEVKLGAALNTLPKLAAETAGPFDLFFIDADKRNNPEYFEWALKLSRPGSVIIVDNVVRGGRVLETDSTDPDIQGTRRLYDRMAKESRVSATALQTVGIKGYDGLAFALVLQ